MDSDEHARSTCGVLDLRQQLVRRSGWQWTVAGGRRRWFVGGDRTAARICAARRRRGHRSSVRPARHSPPPDDIGVVMGWRPLTALGFARVETVVAPAALNNHQNLAAPISGSASTSAWARSACQAAAKRVLRAAGYGVDVQMPLKSGLIRSAF